MHLLLTNDDGYQAVGIQILAETALSLGHTVVVSAPVREQSATSHCISLFKDVAVDRIGGFPYPCFAVHGTPVDSARVGLYLSDHPYDFCLSGINRGENAGTALYYSGTAGAAREAAMLNLPSLALSISADATCEMIRDFAKTAFDTLAFLKRSPLPRLTFLSLNAPALPKEKIKGIRMADISDAFFLDAYTAEENEKGQLVFSLEKELRMEPSKNGSDIALLAEGYITCSYVGGFSCLNRHCPNLESVYEQN